MIMFSFNPHAEFDCKFTFESVFASLNMITEVLETQDCVNALLFPWIIACDVTESFCVLMYFLIFYILALQQNGPIGLSALNFYV